MIGARALPVQIAIDEHRSWFIDWELAIGRESIGGFNMV
jgi:hypothetical protein